MTDTQISRFEQFRLEIDGAARRFAMRWTRHREDADDAVQEAYIRAFRAFDRVSGVSDLRAWFFQIVKRVLMDRARLQKRRPSCVSLDSALEQNPHFEPVDPSADSEKHLLNQVIDPLLLATLETLDPKHVETLEKSLDPTNTEPICRTRLHRARRAFITAFRDTQNQALMNSRQEALA